MWEEHLDFPGLKYLYIRSSGLLRPLKFSSALGMVLNRVSGAQLTAGRHLGFVFPFLCTCQHFSPEIRVLS